MPGLQLKVTEMVCCFSMFFCTCYFHIRFVLFTWQNTVLLTASITNTIWPLKNYKLFFFCFKTRSHLQRNISLEVCIIDFKSCHFSGVTFITCRCSTEKYLLDPSITCAEFSSFGLNNNRNEADGGGTALP